MTTIPRTAQPLPPTSPSHNAPASPPPSPAEPSLAQGYEAVRRFSHTLCEPLATEDYVIQTMENVSPTKWHLAHTSWFFERFLLREFVPGYRAYHRRYDYLFNSYYNAVGPQHCRPNRGLISRPTVAEVYAYRRHVDEHMRGLIDALEAGSAGRTPEDGPAIRHRVVLGLHHEQQHQELMVTDLKHVFSTNPLLPAYRERGDAHPSSAASEDSRSSEGPRWITMEPGVVAIGREQDAPGFAYDNESPRHKHYLAGGRIADRPVTNGEYLAFIEDGGYTRHDLWLSMGWATVAQRGWTHPIYWYREGGEPKGRWMHYTLAGPEPIDPAEPVCHLSYFEADAFARWAGARLPTEFEWETAARVHADAIARGNFADNLRLHPLPLTGDARPGAGEASGPATLRRAFGDVWEWTQSSYGPYPGYAPPPGALGEYNGKFMCNQYVLRGGSCATPAGHIRPTYRNFFSPEARWQFSGLRLARD